MSRAYKVAFIGCGKRAGAHVNAVKGDTRCNVVALTDTKPEAAESMNADAGFGATIYTDHHAMLEAESPDVVISCLWTPLHLPVFRDCVGAGVKAVLSEKPMAPTWGDCQEIARIADTSGCLLTFCHQRRFADGNRKVRQLIADGVFGEIQRMELRSPPNLLDCGTHTVDQALSFNAESPAKWVLGAIDASEPINWFGVPAEGMATGLIVFENGVRATLQTGGPDMDFWGGVRVTGTKGFAEVLWDGQIQRAVVYDDPSWTPPAVDEDKEHHMAGVISNALDCLESGAEPELSHKMALRTSEVLFALYESVRRSARVELPLEGMNDNPFITMLEAGRFGAKA
jgi:UDP-N-acetyl-2-amino-2-deoxyglucuronate dehydrogenase